MTLKICVSIIGQTLEEVLKMINDAEDNEADLIEIRLDFLREQVDLGRIRKATVRPLIATDRLPSDGGFFKGTERERQKRLFNAANGGFDFIDIELETPELEEKMQRLRETGCKVIVSSHKAERPEMGKLNSTLSRQRRLKPDLCKIVTEAETAVDSLTSLQFLAQVTPDTVVCFCMGPLGRVSRVLSPLFGGAFTYAAAAKGREAASGQLTAPEMRQLYSLLGGDS